MTTSRAGLGSLPRRSSSSLAAAAVLLLRTERPRAPQSRRRPGRDAPEPVLAGDEITVRNVIDVPVDYTIVPYGSNRAGEPEDAPPGRGPSLQGQGAPGHRVRTQGPDPDPLPDARPALLLPVRRSTTFSRSGSAPTGVTTPRTSPRMSRRRARCWTGCSRWPASGRDDFVYRHRLRGREDRHRRGRAVRRPGRRHRHRSRAHPRIAGERREGDGRAPRLVRLRGRHEGRHLRGDGGDPVPASGVERPAPAEARKGAQAGDARRLPQLRHSGLGSPGRPVPPRSGTASTRNTSSIFTRDSRADRRAWPVR